MVSRFKIVDEKYIEESKNKSENEDTKNSSEWLKNERNFKANLEEYDKDFLDQRLLKFINFVLYVINK